MSLETLESRVSCGVVGCRGVVCVRVFCGVRGYFGGVGEASNMTTLWDIALREYSAVGISLVLGGVIAAVLLVASLLLTVRQGDVEKVSAYECGFDPFGDARMTFDVRFYLVAILFLIFDLEVSFLFPWAVTLSALPTWGYGSMMVFLAILTVGFIYEWKKGGLDWE